MFELPEYLNFAKQFNSVLAGKIIRRGQLGNSPHKFVWYNRSDEEFSVLTAGKKVGESSARGRWLFVPLMPGYVLVLGECGGRLLYHPPRSALPRKYHLRLEFEDGSFLTAMTQMWGAMELYARGKERRAGKDAVADSAHVPLDAAAEPRVADRQVGRLQDGVDVEQLTPAGLVQQRPEPPA